MTVLSAIRTTAICQIETVPITFAPPADVTKFAPGLGAFEPACGTAVWPPQHNNTIPPMHYMFVFCSCKAMTLMVSLSSAELVLWTGADRLKATCLMSGGTTG